MQLTLYNKRNLLWHHCKGPSRSEQLVTLRSTALSISQFLLNSISPLCSFASHRCSPRSSSRRSSRASTRKRGCCAHSSALSTMLTGPGRHASFRASIRSVRFADRIEGITPDARAAAAWSRPSPAFLIFAPSPKSLNASYFCDPRSISLAEFEGSHKAAGILRHVPHFLVREDSH